MEILTGNIFTTRHQTIVNTVNCVGVMGAGIALEFRLRYPDMYEKYKILCTNKLIDIGNLWLYKAEDRWILNFPTKRHWKFETKPEYLELGLKKFLETYKEKGIKSIAFPLLGASHGGLKEEQSLEIMSRYLTHCDIPVQIWRYDPTAEDDLYNRFITLFLQESEDKLIQQTGIGRRYIKKLRQAINQPDIKSLSRLSSVEGIGIKTLEKVFWSIMHKKQ